MFTDQSTITKPVKILLVGTVVAVFGLLVGATMQTESNSQSHGLDLVSQQKLTAKDFYPLTEDSDLNTWLGVSWDGPSIVYKSNEFKKFEGHEKMVGANITMLNGDKQAVAYGSKGIAYLLKVDTNPKVVDRANLKVAARNLDLTPTIVATKDGFYALTYDGYMETWSVSPQGLKFVSEEKITSGGEKIGFEGNANKKLAWIDEKDGIHQICIREVPSRTIVRLKPPTNYYGEGLHVTDIGHIFYYTDTQCWLWQSPKWISVAKFPVDQLVFVESKNKRAAIWQLDDLYVIDTDSGKHLAHLKVRFARPVQFSSDAKELVVGNFGTLQRFRLTAP